MPETIEERPPALKKRKIRKGTQSCWECKRRKIRCSFFSPTESVCDGCKSRQVKCISQEFPKSADAAVDTSQNVRLGRVEALVEQLAKRVDSDFTSLRPYDAPDATAIAKCRVGVDAQVTSAFPGRTIARIHETRSQSIDYSSNCNGICNALLAVWPSRHDFDVITSVDIGTSVLFHGVVCLPYSRFLSKDMPSSREMLQLPPPASHPVLIARKLLMLGSFLQGIPPGTVKNLGKLGGSYRQLMSDLVETARRLVTSNEELVESLEGIECIMIESMYYNNAGNLRRAWLTNRRAMAIAQMIGLPVRNAPMPKMLDLDTRERIDPNHMWLRLIITDRYLSLMLGLPQAYKESRFASPEALEGCAPMERLERLESAIGGLIIQRNRVDLHDLEATQSIDKLLQEAANSMSSQWWLTPDVSSIAGSDATAFSETIRIMGQLTHYHLLAQLHLPYILQPSTERRYDYSKMTAVNASREILLRFVRIRESNMIAAYCRGIDFLAFYASTALCLAHVLGARQQSEIHMSNSATVFHFLAHQRLGDHGLVESTLHIMERMVHEYNDAIACKVASMLRNLLVIEAAAANGDYYKAEFCSESDKQGFLGDDNVDDDPGTLSIDIPHLGIIKIEHGSVSSLSVTRQTEEYQATTNSEESISLNHNPFDREYVLATDADDWTLQGVDMALFDSLIRGMGD